MTDLRDLAIAAHGGSQRWRASSVLRVNARIGGGIWGAKGQGGKLDEVDILVETQRQRTEYWPFGAPDRHSVYTPEAVAVVTDGGQEIAHRDDPRAAFADHVGTTQWDELHLAYFTGYAMWNYLNTPFLFQSDGFETEEIEPWDEDGATWRRLRVRFPPNIATHCREQLFYFDKDNILRRHDYVAEVTGGGATAHIVDEPKEFGGLVFPTKRRVYRRGADNRPILDRVAVAIDIANIVVE